MAQPPKGFPAHMFTEGAELEDVLKDLTPTTLNKGTRIKADTPPPPKECMSPDDILWAEFGVKPNWPVRTKIEHLTMFYRLRVSDMAKLLQFSEESVEEEVEALKDDWIGMGKLPKGKERELHRGRVLAKLRRMEATLESALTSTPEDAKLLTLLLNIQDRVAKMLGLDTDKRDAATEEEAEGDSFSKAIEDLSLERQRELHARLTKRD